MRFDKKHSYTKHVYKMHTPSLIKQSLLQLELSITHILLFRLYQAGFNPNVAALYGPISYPVPRGTPSISSLIQWDHSATHDVPTEKDFDLQSGEGGCGRVPYTVSIEDNANNENHYLVGHKIDGRILYPATGKMCTNIRLFLPK